MNSEVSAEVVEQWRKDWNEFEPSITYRNDPEYGMIEFFIDGKLITTWSYSDNPHDALGEFRNVVKTGFLLGRQTAYIELPKPTEDNNFGGSYFDSGELMKSIQKQGYQCHVKGERVS